jgi:hypothetical protein
MFKNRWGNYSPPCALDSGIQAGMTVMQVFVKIKFFSLNTVTLAGHIAIDND